MNPRQAKRTVVLSLVAAGALASIEDLRERDFPKLRIFLGAVFAGIVLSSVAEGAPDLAGTFALLILTTTVFGVGLDTWQAITSVITREGDDE